tara:strand:- start:139 stop:993 length:855 start_codon:yes stop_codon:yes gene_type:complete
VNALEHHFSCDRWAWGLRWIISLQCFGYAASLGVPSHINSWLLPLHGDSFAGAVDRTIALFLWLTGCSLPFLGRASLRIPQTQRSSPVARYDFVLLCFVAGWAFVNAVFSWRMNIEDPFHATDPFGHAVRFVAPVVLLAHFTGIGSRRKLQWFLRLAVASTFIGHGLAAYWLKPGFVDLIVGTLDTFLGSDWRLAEEREQLAIILLPCIGRMDFLLAFLILLPTKWRKTIALWMAIWGFVTATSRLTAFGVERWPDLIIRTANWGIPLLLWLEMRNTIKSRKDL